VPATFFSSKTVRASHLECHYHSCRRVLRKLFRRLGNNPFLSSLSGTPNRCPFMGMVSMFATGSISSPASGPKAGEGLKPARAQKQPTAHHRCIDAFDHLNAE